MNALYDNTRIYDLHAQTQAQTAAENANDTKHNKSLQIQSKQNTMKNKLKTTEKK